jgi:hypothetical protein
MDLRSSRLEALHAPGTNPTLDKIGRLFSPALIDKRSARSRDQRCLPTSPARLATDRHTQQATCTQSNGGAVLPKRVNPHRSPPAADES